MIIACPECSGPFEIPDDQIAALVQIECPHCSFRMILDFAAANDPALVEEGMRMASGFRSAADYRAAASGAVGEPTVRPAPPTPLEEITTRPETPRAEAPPLRSVPQHEPEPPPRAEAQQFRPPFENTEAPRSQTVVAERQPPHDVRPQPRATVSPQPEPPPPRGETVVGPPPEPPPSYPDYDEDAPTRVHDFAVAPAEAAELPVPRREAPTSGTFRRPPAAQWTPPAAPTSQSYRDESPSEEAETRPEPELPPPPSRPAFRPAVEAPAPVPRAARVDTYADELDTSSELDDYPVRKGGVAGTVVVSILLVAALALLGASLALKNTADPRPLLEDLFRNGL